MTEAVRHLSNQQEKVLQGVAEGLPNKLIAHHLGIAEGTVKVHLKTVNKKLGLRNRTQAAAWVHRFRPDLIVGALFSL